MFFHKEQINKKEVIKWGLFGGLAELVYIVLIGLLMNYIGNRLDHQSVIILNFIIMLTLFVFSAGVSGLFVFGYPAYLALQKRFPEAVCTALISLSVIIVGFIAALIMLISL